jgi:hypothetical protein
MKSSRKQGERQPKYLCLRGPDTLGPVGVTEIADAGEVELPDVTVYELGTALPAMGPAPALTERTSSVEPAGEAERATTAKLEALVPWARGVARHEVEHIYELPPEALS